MEDLGAVSEILQPEHSDRRWHDEGREYHHISQSARQSVGWYIYRGYAEKNICQRSHLPH